MAYVQTSAFDPVFWVHHSKIDQIWTMWMYKSGVTWGKYSESWFDERPWHFYDADGKEKSEPRRFFVDNQKNLAYRYDIEPLGGKAIGTAGRNTRHRRQWSTPRRQGFFLAKSWPNQ